ncbi:MAG: hypothetical protein ACLGPL_00790, partial [Acidobacteriota bacterium]
ASGTPLCGRLSTLKRGDPVFFSGAFLEDDQDFLLESSMNEERAMKKPEFIMKFSDISRE